MNKLQAHTHTLTLFIVDYIRDNINAFFPARLALASKKLWNGFQLVQNLQQQKKNQYQTIRIRWHSVHAQLLQSLSQ